MMMMMALDGGEFMGSIYEVVCGAEVLPGECKGSAKKVDAHHRRHCRLNTHTHTYTASPSAISLPRRVLGIEPHTTQWTIHATRALG